MCRRDAVEQLRRDAPSVEVSECLDDLGGEWPIEEACVALKDRIRDWLIFLQEAKTPEKDALCFSFRVESPVVLRNLTASPRGEIGWQLSPLAPGGRGREDRVHVGPQRVNVTQYVQGNGARGRAIGGRRAWPRRSQS